MLLIHSREKPKVCPWQKKRGADYYNELKAANNALNHYRDEYVYFADSDAPSFVVIARATDVIQEMKKTGAADQAKKMQQSPYKGALFVHSYYKGVAGEDLIYDAVGTEGTEYRLLFNAPFHGKTVYSINWDTGRYRYIVYALDYSKTVPAAETSGKCELIHPL